AESRVADTLKDARVRDGVRIAHERGHGLVAAVPRGGIAGHDPVADIVVLAGQAGREDVQRGGAHAVLARVAQGPDRAHAAMVRTRSGVRARTEVVVVTGLPIGLVRVDAQEVGPAGADGARIVVVARQAGRLVAHAAVGSVARFQPVALVAVVARDRHARVALA